LEDEKVPTHTVCQGRGRKDMLTHQLLVHGLYPSGEEDIFLGREKREARPTTMQI